MRIYTVHDRPGSLAPDRDVVLIKEGFCWPAFFLTGLWALWHRLWLTFVLLLAAVAGIEAALYFAGADELTAAASRLAYSLVIGFGANDWRRGGLAQRDYRPLGVVAAASREAALRRYFDLHPDISTGPRTAIGETGF